MRFPNGIDPLPPYTRLAGNGSEPDPTPPAAPGAHPGEPPAPFPGEPGDQPAPQPPGEPVRVPAEPEPKPSDLGLAGETAIVAEFVKERFRSDRLELALASMIIGHTSAARAVTSALGSLRPEELALPAMQSLAADMARAMRETADCVQALLAGVDKPEQTARLAAVN